MRPIETGILIDGEDFGSEFAGQWRGQVSEGAGDADGNQVGRVQHLKAKWERLTRVCLPVVFSRSMLKKCGLAVGIWRNVMEFKSQYSKTLRDAVTQGTPSLNMAGGNTYELRVSLDEAVPIVAARYETFPEESRNPSLEILNASVLDVEAIRTSGHLEF